MQTALVAPSKNLVTFEHSGYEAFVDEPETFNSTIAEAVWASCFRAVTEGALARFP